MTYPLFSRSDDLFRWGSSYLANLPRRAGNPLKLRSPVNSSSTDGPMASGLRARSGQPCRSGVQSSERAAWGDVQLLPASHREEPKLRGVTRDNNVRNQEAERKMWSEAGAVVRTALGILLAQGVLKLLGIAGWAAVVTSVLIGLVILLYVLYATRTSTERPGLLEVEERVLTAPSLPREYLRKAIGEACKPLGELTSVAVSEHTNAYLGKWLIVNGTITNVKDSLTGSADVVLGGVSDDDAIFEVCCTFGESNGNEVVNYRKKDRVSIAGRITNVQRWSIDLEACEVVDHNAGSSGEPQEI